MTVINISPTSYDSLARRADELFRQQQQLNFKQIDRLFAVLMGVQWLAGIVFACLVSPRQWAGQHSAWHPHLYAAIFLGAAISALPICLAVWRPGRFSTRAVIAVAQMLWSALLIHLTGGRIETHFHVFGSLAFLAFYRDWRVLVPATVVVALDHLIRGIVLPQSVYGVMTASLWRSIEHASWVIFEDIILVLSCLRGVREMRLVAEREAAIGESDDRFRLMVDGVRDYAILMLDAGGKVANWNSGSERIKGYTAEEILGRHFSCFYTPEDVEHGKPQKALERARTEGRFEEEGVRVRKDGTRFSANVVIAALRDEHNELVGFSKVTRDITERRRAEEELRLQKSLLESQSEAAIEGILVVSMDGKILSYNRRFVEMWGIPTEILRRGSNAEALQSIQDKLAHPQEFMARVAYLSQNPDQVSREEIRLNDGRVFDRYSAPVKNADVGYYGRVWFFQDITERKNAEAEREQLHERLLEASRQAGMAEVATGVLHNVGNVLNSVNVAATLAADKLRGSKVGNFSRAAAMLNAHSDDLANFVTTDEKGKQLPAYFVKLAEHLGKEQEEVLNELTSLANNIEHIKQVVNMQQSYARVSGVTEMIAAKELVEEAVRLNAAAFDRHHIQIVREYAELPDLMIDKHKALQILVNLVSNVKHALDGNALTDRLVTLRTFRSEADPQRVCIEVIDNGTGITAENLTNIFSHGFTTRKDGHGFGLHSAALAAKAMGGALTVSSQGPGKGATFTLELPLARAEAAAQ